jgi:hypothetical protein
MEYVIFAGLAFSSFHVFMTIKNYIYISSKVKKCERMKYEHR